MKMNRLYQFLTTYTNQISDYYIAEIRVTRNQLDPQWAILISATSRGELLLSSYKCALDCVCISGVGQNA